MVITFNIFNRFQYHSINSIVLNAFKHIAVIKQVIKEGSLDKLNPIFYTQKIIKALIMTTEKQIKANQDNSKKSTGANTNKGKLVVAGNAIKHGLFAQRLILNDENLDEYAQLIDGLITSLNPVGTLEQLLVEKIAVATWKQLRLTRAESASIELDRRMERSENIDYVSKAIGRKWDEPELGKDDLKEETDEDREQIIYCSNLVAQFDTIHNEVLINVDLVKLKTEGSLIYEALVNEADQEEIELNEYINDYLKTDEQGIHEWACNLHTWCRKELIRFNRKAIVLKVSEQLRNKLTAPINNELLARYQAGIDNELYKAIEALRKQQEWRSKAIIEDVAA